MGTRMKLHSGAIAYSMTTMGASMMNHVFFFYYVKIFLNRYHIPEWWFQVSQVLFMIWNAINDPLFGYIQDNANLQCVKSRRHAILYGAPLFAISFIVPWFPWASDHVKDGWIIGLHLMFSLCLYDTLFTFVLLAQCCLFTEMSKKHEDRLRLVKYSQVASLVGAGSVMTCELVSHNLEHYLRFQILTVLIAICAFFCFRYTGLNARTEYDIEDSRNEETSCNRPEDVGLSIWRAVWQIISQTNFICFVAMNFCQIFHQTFLANFSVIICDALIPKEAVPDLVRSVFHGLIFILPQILVIVCTPVVARWGSFYTIRFGFLCKIITPVCLYFVGWSYPYVLMLFILFDSALASATFSLFNISLSDIADDDMVVYQRKRPATSMIFGTNALVTKPAISLAPMVIVTILNRYGYEQYKAGKLLAVAELNNVMFLSLCIIPVTIGLLQNIVWSYYTLRNSHETIAKYVET